MTKYDFSALSHADRAVAANAIARRIVQDIHASYGLTSDQEYAERVCGPLKSQILRGESVDASSLPSYLQAEATWVLAKYAPVANPAIAYERCPSCDGRGLEDAHEAGDGNGGPCRVCEGALSVAVPAPRDSARSLLREAWTKGYLKDKVTGDSGFESRVAAVLREN